MLRRSLLRFASCCGLAVFAAHAVYASAAEPPAPKENYVPDPEIESLIEKTADRNSAVAKIALEQLQAAGPAGERAVNAHLQKDRENRLRYAELAAKLGKGRTGYRVTLELQPDGSGTVTLWSDRTLLAECGRRYDRLMGALERNYTDEDLRKNLYSKVELIRFMDDGMKHLESRVDMAHGAIETIGLLSFKNFESFAKFGEGFDPGGFYMINGASLYDTEAGVRAYRFHKGKETNRDLYAKNLYLFHAVRWEFVLDCKGKVRSSNATRTEGSKLIWNFDICQMLRGEAQIDAQFDAAGLAPRPAPKDEAIALPSTIAQQPVAIPAKKVIHARACKHSGSWQELTEHNQLVELDARNSIGREGPLQYRWRQTYGTDLKLLPEALTKDRIGMRIPEPGEYRFELIVTCNGAASAPEEVVVYVDAETADKPAPDKVASAEPPKTTPKETDPNVKPRESHTADHSLDGLDKSPKPAPQAETRKSDPPPPAQPKVDPKRAPDTTQIAAVKNDPTKAIDTDTPKPAPVPPVSVVPVEVKLDPAKSKELHAQGVKLMKAGNYKEAQPLLNDAVAADPKNLDATLDFGITLMEIGDLRAAMLKFEEVTSNSDNPEALMYAGHCSARAGAMDEAGQWYRRGVSQGGDKVAWEYSWQFGNIRLARKDYEAALHALQDAEKDAVKAKVNDYRLHRDLAVALHNLTQDDAALKHLQAMQELGYTPDAQLLADVTKGAGGAGGAAKPSAVADAGKPVKPDVPPPQHADPPKAEPAKTEPPRTEKKVEPAAPKTTEPAQAAPKVESAAQPRVADNDPPKSQMPPKHDPPAVSSPNPPAVSSSKPPSKPAQPVAAGTDPKSTVPPTPAAPEKTRAEKRAEARPLYPKRALPPIPKDFDGCMAAGKRAYQDALGHVLLKTEEDKIKAAQSFDEAEAMFRGAWALHPGDETVSAEFRNLAEYIGAIALVKNAALKTRVKGMVVLDASASIAPKEKPLYLVWEQVDGENLGLRREELTEKIVSLKKIRTPGVYKFELAVSDGIRGGNPVTVTVEVEE